MLVRMNRISTRMIEGKTAGRPMINERQELGRTRTLAAVALTGLIGLTGCGARTGLEFDYYDRHDADTQPDALPNLDAGAEADAPIVNKECPSGKYELIAPKLIQENSFGGAVAWNGQNYGVFYNRKEGEIWGTYFKKFSSEGSLISTEALVKSVGSEIEEPMAYLNGKAVWTGNSYGLSWDSLDQNNYSINFSVVDPQGVETKVIGKIHNGSTSAWNPFTHNLIWNSQAKQFALAYDVCGSDIYKDCHSYLSLFNEKGNPIGDEKMINDGASALAFQPSMVWQKEENAYRFVWSDGRDLYGDPYKQTTELYSAVYDINGNKLNGDAKLTAKGLISWYPAQVANGAESLLLWHELNMDQGTNTVRYAQEGALAAGLIPGSELEFSVPDTRDKKGIQAVLSESTYGTSLLAIRKNSSIEMKYFKFFFSVMDGKGQIPFGPVEVSATLPDRANCDFTSLTWTGSDYGLIFQCYTLEDAGSSRNSNLYFSRVHCLGGK